MVKVACVFVALFALVGGIGLWVINNPERVKKTLASASPIPGVTNAPKPTEKPVAETPGAKLDEWVSIGPVRVRVTGIRVGQAQLVDWQGTVFQSGNRVTIIDLDIENTSKTKLVRLESWNADRKSAGQSARATDAHGLGYGSVDAGGSNRLSYDHLSSSSDLAPKQAVKEQIALRECRTEHAGHLDVELPAVNVGESGVFRFRIKLMTEKELEAEARRIAKGKEDDARKLERDVAIEREEFAVREREREAARVIAERKARDEKATIILKASRPIVEGANVWIFLDGKEFKPWPEGTSELRLTVPAMTKRIEVVSEYRKKQYDIFDESLTLVEGEVRTIIVRPDLPAAAKKPDGLKPSENPSGTLTLRLPEPATRTYRPWVLVDGKKVADWSEAGKSLVCVVASGKRRVVVQVVEQNMVKTLMDKEFVVEADGKLAIDVDPVK